MARTWHCIEEAPRRLARRLAEMMLGPCDVPDHELGHDVSNHLLMLQQRIVALVKLRQMSIQRRS